MPRRDPAEQAAIARSAPRATRAMRELRTEVVLRLAVRGLSGARLYAAVRTLAIAERTDRARATAAGVEPAPATWGDVLPSARTVDNLAREAERRFELASRTVAARELGRVLLRYEDLYARSYAAEDYAECRRLLAGMRAVLGLDPAVPVNLHVSDDADAPRSHGAPSFLGNTKPPAYWTAAERIEELARLRDLADANRTRLRQERGDGAPEQRDNGRPAA